MAEVVGGELGLPARPDAGLGAGHDAGVGDEQVDPPPGGEEAVGERTDAVEVTQVQLVDLDVVQAFEGLLGGLAAAGRDDDVGAGCR